MRRAERAAAIAANVTDDEADRICGSVLRLVETLGGVEAPSEPARCPVCTGPLPPRRRTVCSDACRSRIANAMPVMVVEDLDLSWRPLAACIGRVELMLGPTAQETPRALELREAEAKELCMACPVQAQCLEDALEHRETAGVRGGLTPLERLGLEHRR